MRAAACLCRSILRGTEKSVPRSDRAYKAPGDPGKQYQRLATATVVVTAATAAEQQQDDPDAAVVIVAEHIYCLSPRIKFRSTVRRGGLTTR